MLSILIPVYNYDIRPLVNEIRQQCESLDISFEILCYDDGSQKSYQELNRKLDQDAYVKYVELTENIGRSRIRNLLGQKSNNEYLLFIDCDSKIVRSDFIQNYLRRLKPNTVLCGGRVYEKVPPRNLEQYFHWYYGSRREQRQAVERSVSPYHSFLTCQFVIPRELFLSIQFEESIREYGHEDTLFGLALKKRNIPIVHLDNPLLHDGLENTQVFLQKSRQAIENLGHICQKDLGIETKLLSTYQKISNMGLSNPIITLGNISEKALLKNFHSSRPNLHFFDLYKLTHLTKVMEKTKKQ